MVYAQLRPTKQSPHWHTQHSMHSSTSPKQAVALLCIQHNNEPLHCTTPRSTQPQPPSAVGDVQTHTATAHTHYPAPVTVLAGRNRPKIRSCSCVIAVAMGLASRPCPVLSSPSPMAAPAAARPRHPLCARCTAIHRSSLASQAGQASEHASGLRLRPPIAAALANAAAQGLSAVACCRQQRWPQRAEQRRAGQQCAVAAAGPTEADLSAEDMDELLFQPNGQWADIPHFAEPSLELRHVPGGSGCQPPCACTHVARMAVPHPARCTVPCARPAPHWLCVCAPPPPRPRHHFPPSCTARTHYTRWVAGPHMHTCMHALAGAGVAVFVTQDVSAGQLLLACGPAAVVRSREGTAVIAGPDDDDDDTDGPTGAAGSDGATSTPSISGPTPLDLAHRIASGGLSPAGAAWLGSLYDGNPDRSGRPRG